jgi:hypothetical protein
MSTLAPSNNHHHVLRDRWEIPSVDQVIVEVRAGVVWANTYNKFDPTQSVRRLQRKRLRSRRRIARFVAEYLAELIIVDLAFGEICLRVEVQEDKGDSEQWSQQHLHKTEYKTGEVESLRL